MSFKVGFLPLVLFSIGVAHAGETVQVAGVPLEETYRAFDPSNHWTRVDYVLRPTTGSYIRCRLILPSAERWTGRFWGLGNGSEGGNVWHEPSFARRGDASVHCDLGTSERRLYRYPPAFDDFGWRATHLMTVTGKALTERFYGRKISRAYFRGGSTGGNQGMREAMDFPDDYDGIAVDVPAQARVSMCALYWWVGRAIRDEAGAVVVSTNQCVAMARAARDWFSEKDEPYARGRFLTDPRYSPEAEEGIYALAAKSCAELMRPGMRERWHRIFTGPVINGRRAHTGFPFGADLSGLTRRFNYNLAWLVGRDFDQRKVTPEMIEAYARRFGPQVNAEKEDLSAFAARGGKLLVMPGLEDEYVPYTAALDWYERAAERMGGLDRLREFCRLFLLPGRAHGRGRGMDQALGVEDVLVDWVEKGNAPERLQAEDYPIAAYPDKIGGNAVTGWCVKPFGRLGIVRRDALYTHGRDTVVPANRSAVVDADGVMRWADDGSEVAVFGVNYYTPFALDYRLLGERGIDRKETIRRDVAHFRRLGLNALRLHVFDREVSNRDGSLRENDHLDLLDYLIAECASNGIYTVLTPIAAWGGNEWTSDTRGFAAPVTIKELTSDRTLWQVQARYEEEFARHRNRYTGRRYADDPAVLCFELINEPAYPSGTKPEDVAAFANALLDGIRRSGTGKPVLYSATWNKRNDCIPFLRTDGVTGVYYVTGLRAYGALRGLHLGCVRESSLKADPRHAKMAKVIYEFDAADVTGAYMYPAMAAVFRSEGVQAAMQFQYDATPLAGSNDSYMTHYLNLVYTPQKAVSLAIAAEVFRRTPRGRAYRPDAHEVVFPPFRVNADRNLSEMVTETRLYYTSTPETPVPSPEKLEHVWGCGASPVAASEGSGAYFLDRIETGLWRLQVYPDVLPVADPHTGRSGKKTVVLGNAVKLKVLLPDLGTAFTVFPLGDDRPVARAADGAFSAAPGDYVLTREREPDAARLSRARRADVTAYAAPPPDPPGDYRPWPTPPDVRARQLRETFATRDLANVLERPIRRTMKNYKGESYCNVRRPVDAEALSLAFPAAGRPQAVVISGKALADHAEPVELALTLSDGTVWGTETVLPVTNASVRIERSSFRHFGTWDHRPDPPSGTLPDLEKAIGLTASIGLWMEKGACDVPHGFEIESLRLMCD